MSDKGQHYKIKRPILRSQFTTKPSGKIKNKKVANILFQKSERTVHQALTSEGAESLIKLTKFNDTQRELIINVHSFNFLVLVRRVNISTYFIDGSSSGCSLYMLETVLNLTNILPHISGVPPKSPNPSAFFIICIRLGLRTSWIRGTQEGPCQRNLETLNY